jgi:hypothetical protein
MKFLLGLLVLPLIALPSMASECRPKVVSIFSVATQKSIQTVNYKGSTYRLVKITGQGPNEKFPAVYREKDNRCWVAWADPVGDQVGLSNGVPRPVAIAFSKAGFERMIAKKGRESFQQWVLKLASFAPEDAESLKLLGISLPDRAKIRPWDKPEHEELIH